VNKIHKVRVSDSDWNHSEILVLFHGGHKEEALCYYCGWTSSNQVNDGGYDLLLKVYIVNNNSVLWTLGPDWFVRDETNDVYEHRPNDYQTQKYLRDNHVQVPLVEMIRLGQEKDKFLFTIMARAKGEQISVAKKRLTSKQKVDIALDLKRCMANGDALQLIRFKEWMVQNTRIHESPTAAGLRGCHMPQDGTHDRGVV